MVGSVRLLVRNRDALNPSDSSLKTLLSIQYLRGFAALAVVLFHTCQWAGVNFDIGAAGVDVFFIISGFVMWVATRSLPPATFLWRRLVRVVPAYWVVTLLLALLIAAGALPNIRLQAGHLVLSLLLIPHLDPKGLPFPLLPPGWSLSYEAIFYLVFAAALAAPARLRFRIVIASLAAIGAAGFIVYPIYELGANPTMLEFAAGVWLARVYTEGRLPRRVIGWALLIVGLDAFAALRLLGVHSDLWRNLIWGLPALAIVAGAVSIEAHGAVADWPLLKLLGDSSYGLYLVHWPVIALVDKVIQPDDPAKSILISICASIGAGLLARQIFEKPLISMLGGHVSPRANTPGN